MSQRIEYPSGTKVCRACGIERPLGEYYRVKARDGQPTGRCKRCFQSSKVPRERPSPAPIVCDQCGSVFTPTRPSDRNKYCSAKCVKTSWARRHGIRPMRGAIVDGRKMCTRCKEWKTLDCFGRRADRKMAPLSECKPCASRRMADYVRGERGRNQRYAKKYGVSIEWYEATLARQSGVCAICGAPPNMGNRTHPRLAIDHDHATGTPRGLLCFNCNGGLGQFKDDPGLLARAQEYILSHHQP